MSADIPFPKDPRHQRFADLILAGEPSAKAYREAGFPAKSAHAQAVNASRLLKKADIVAYMKAVQAQAAQGAVASLQYKRELLFQIMDVPLMDIDPHHPDKLHGRLLKKYKVGAFGPEFEKHCALAAMRLDNDLAGEGNPQADAVSKLAQAIASLESSPLPADDDRM